MVKITVKDEMSSVLNKEIIINKFAKCCHSLGFDVNKYVLTENFKDGTPDGYEIEFTNNS